MSYLSNLFSPSLSYSFFSLMIAAAAGFFIGFIFKSKVVSKHKKRVLHLEDEMLLNHSRILELEKELHQVKEENAKLRGGSSQHPKAELRVS